MDGNAEGRRQSKKGTAIEPEVQKSPALTLKNKPGGKANTRAWQQFPMLSILPATKPVFAGALCSSFCLSWLGCHNLLLLYKECVDLPRLCSYPQPPQVNAHTPRTKCAGCVSCAGCHEPELLCRQQGKRCFQGGKRGSRSVRGEENCWAQDNLTRAERAGPQKAPQEYVASVFLLASIPECILLFWAVSVFKYHCQQQ